MKYYQKISPPSPFPNNVKKKDFIPAWGEFFTLKSRYFNITF